MGRAEPSRVRLLRGADPNGPLRRLLHAHVFDEHVADGAALFVGPVALPELEVDALVGVRQKRIPERDVVVGRRANASNGKAQLKKTHVNAIAGQEEVEKSCNMPMFKS